MQPSPLTPTAYLERSARVWAERVAAVDGARSWTYAGLAERCHRLAGALADMGVRPGDRVAVLAPNTSLLLEAHFGVPFAGAVLVAMNVRLRAEELAYIVDHAEARVLLAHRSLEPVAAEVARLPSTRPRVVVGGEGGTADEYEQRLAAADPLTVPCSDELGLLALNYTSGTTGHPKGVEYHHRGAYLQALSMAYHCRVHADSVYLWTLPMFHCNGWCFPWAVTAAGGTHLLLPAFDPAQVWQHLLHDGVTHLCGAPTVLTMLASHPDAAPTPQPVWVGTGGAPPSPTLLAQMAAFNLDVTHLYGLTETFGPAALCDWNPAWDELDPAEQAMRKARQGVGSVVSEPLRVVDDQGHDVPADGTTMGQVAISGNNVMRGYHKDEESTRRATPYGAFLTGDLAVMHPDGYVELRDRAKDIVISGGENISTIEVEQAIASHPAVLEVAVIGVPDERWGEVPRAYIALRDGTTATADELIAHARERLAHFKAPKSVVFGPLPKTSTGKVQKYVLRTTAWEGHAKLVN